MQVTDALEAYTVSLLRHKNHYLLLQRAPTRAFAPGRWTGLGGHVEAGEYDHLRASALREVQEEAGISPQDISNFMLRRALLVNRPAQPLRVLLYFTGCLEQMVHPTCPEGVLAWKQAAEFNDLDIIETTRPVLKCLIGDMNTDPGGSESPKIGLTVFDAEGIFQKVVWAG